MKTNKILLSLRKSQKISQKTLADLLGISITAYQNYEYGKSELNYDRLIKLADFYGVTTDYLLGRPKAKSQENPVDLIKREAEQRALELEVLKTDANYIFQNETTTKVSDEFSEAEKEHIIKYHMLDIFGKYTVDRVLNAEYARFTAEPKEEGKKYNNLLDTLNDIKKLNNFDDKILELIIENMKSLKVFIENTEIIKTINETTRAIEDLNEKVEAIIKKDYQQQIEIANSLTPGDDLNIDIKMYRIIQRIKSRRKDLNLSYQTLAERTGLSKSTLQRYETGDIANIPLSKIETLAKGLETTPQYIMGWVDKAE